MSTIVFTRLGPRDKDVFTLLGERKRSIHSRLGPDVALRHRHASRKRSTSRSVETQAEGGKIPGSSFEATSHALVNGGHWKSKKHRPNYEYDLSQPWLCKENDPFTARIWNFEVPKRTRKTYDGTGDLEDQINIFQAAAKIERWAMPTWCHMFNSTLIGSARVWFDKLPPESIDNYEMLRKAFLGNYSQQKKYIKDPVEIHHIKQMEGEPMESFMERFKAESIHVSGAPECMRISGFMHGITNPDLIKNLNDNIPKSVDEMMSVTTAFLRGETSKEVLAMETVKFKAPPPMTGPVENRNNNKFYEFYGDKGHNTDECIHLRNHIEEAVKSGQLSHLVKEIKQGGKRGEQTKIAKKRGSSQQRKSRDNLHGPDLATNNKAENHSELLRRPRNLFLTSQKQ
ncbi:reverse transcriptase domain-containing protein [Tanacetum coccineum]